jgi:hypothetical protein
MLRRAMPRTVGKNVLNVEEQEDFVQHMVAQYTDMLREHMADPTV